MTLKELHDALGKLLADGVPPDTQAVTLRDGFYGGPENVYHDVGHAETVRMELLPGVGWIWAKGSETADVGTVVRIE